MQVITANTKLTYNNFTQVVSIMQILLCIAGVVRSLRNQVQVVSNLVELVDAKQV
jgi:hypothetical protein